jgi:hypothetical protein
MPLYQIVLNPKQLLKGPHQPLFGVPVQTQTEHRRRQRIRHETHQGIHLHQRDMNLAVARLTRVNLPHHIQIFHHLAVVGSRDQGGEIAGQVLLAIRNLRVIHRQVLQGSRDRPLIAMLAWQKMPLGGILLNQLMVHCVHQSGYQRSQMNRCVMNTASSSAVKPIKSTR